MEASLWPVLLSIGCNTTPNCSDWSRYSGIVAFGAEKNVVLYDPLQRNCHGIIEIMKGHTGFVTVVRFFRGFFGEKEGIISGSTDSSVRIWRRGEKYSECVYTISCCTGSVHIIGVHGCYVGIGTADGFISIWKIGENDTGNLVVEKIQEMKSVNMLPLSMCFYELPESLNMILAVAGSSNFIDIYVSCRVERGHVFTYKSSIEGHRDWIRGLDITVEEKTGDLLLASASQDKHAKIWRITRKFVGGNEKENNSTSKNHDEFDFDLFQMNKIMSFSLEEDKTHEYSISFDALLVGHDDWVFTCLWHPYGELKLLTASADTSLIIWHLDHHSGICISSSRIGEMGSLKGVSTASGGFGGFCGGLWGPNGKSIACWCKSGGWKIFSNIEDNWVQRLSITGHTKPVKSISWSPGGEFFVSSSLDQTTRLFSPWIRSDEDGNLVETWHEISRPQIHGYDINSVCMLDKWKLVAGADEKVIRIFNPVKNVASLISKLSNLSFDKEIEKLSDVANVPLLGLSNKAVDLTNEVPNDLEDFSDNKDQLNDLKDGISKNYVGLEIPPFEDYLQRYTLWPEIEKLYGHGYEIISVASSHDKTLIATTCKATTSEHAVLRLFDTSTWQEILPPLAAHSLTVTRVKFSNDDKYILSVGRDRKFALFYRTDEKNVYKLIEARTAHSRIIWDCCWAPDIVGYVFVTASRDKTLKIWKFETEEMKCECITILKLSHAVTSADICPYMINDSCFLAIGMENGLIVILKSNGKDISQWEKSFNINEQLLPGGFISQIQWRPYLKSNIHYFGVASEDHSVRVYGIKF
ncbi:hypothetical protein T552_01800 [Pneumocystis carinii B80]|uniref:Elongator complex protein 2 n=1 Tax=Pneumocystis carinii (strain B80) TaxID=1408658 RepID=A0A0W4ZJI0_PNEC8|nr:hypothetical protein T552_01800 [Pneumocystis carinii B80]KTW28540.1 hypothetical protein T552_01800 [Pneumocystis carinii B80]